MQYCEQSPRTVYHENNSTASFLAGHNQTRWESARPSPQTEPWTFGKQSGPMPLAQRPTLHKPLPDIGDERYQTSFAPRHQGKSRSLAMAVTELIAPDNTPRPFTAPASFNPVGHQAFGAAHYPSGNATYVPDGSESTVRARVCVFRSAGCDHAVPCLMAGLESVVTLYNGVPTDGWRALDKFADLTMGPEEPIEEHIDRFCTIFHAHSQALIFFPVHLFAHLFFRSLAMYHDNLRKAGEYYLTIIDPEGTLDKLFAHLWNVEQSLKLLQTINTVERTRKRTGESRSGSRRGNPMVSKYSTVTCTMSHPSSPESDIRTRISAWDSPNARKGNSPSGTGPLSDASMEISFNQPIQYQMRPLECDIKLPPCRQQHEGDFSNVEMDAVNIMMQLGRK